MAVFAISGLSACGSSTTGKLLARKLGLKFFSAGAYYKKFSKGKETEKAINMMETRRGFGKPLNYLVDEAAIKIAKKNSAVIDSKIAFYLLRNIADFFIWLEAPTNVRALRVAGRDNISLKEAKKELIAKERLERKKFKDIYGFDHLSQKRDADIVINTGNKTPEQIVKLIINAYKKRKLTIAISGEPRAGSTTTGHALAKRLKIKYFSPGEKFKGKMKTSGAALNTWKDKGTNKRYHEYLDKLQEEFAKKSNVVISGKLSVHKLKNLSDFSVWLYAKKERRIQRLMKTDKVSKKEATKIINEREAIERKNWKKMYGFDYFDQRKEADMRINTSNVSPEQAAQLILKEMKKRKVII
jgi:cytidylate kinase